jgi:ribA/ribD-fused uncharacterized protein
MKKQVHKSKAPIIENCIYFSNRHTQRSSAAHIFLNEHFYCIFRDEDGTVYYSCSHYYHAMKLRIMGDKTAAAKILAAKSGDQARSLAKELEKPYLKTEAGKRWEESKVKTMREAIALKFDQNPELMKQLLLTGDRILIEDHPKDSFW